MSYQPKEGSGALFKNDKGDNPARPDYRGDVMVGGVVYELSAWIKPLPSDASKRFMSLSAKPKDAGHSRAAPPNRSAPPGNAQRPPPSRRPADYDDGNPF